MPDITAQLAAVNDIILGQKPEYAGAVVVMLRKAPGTGGWERAGTVTDGWKYEPETNPKTGAREEVLTIFETADNTPQKINALWPAFDIVKADGSFTRYTKGVALPVRNGFARKWRFMARPNTEDRTPTPP